MPSCKDHGVRKALTIQIPDAEAETDGVEVLRNIGAEGEDVVGL
jgi:hypothetical protein